MAVSNMDMLEVIATAKKAITTADAGSSVLQPAFYNKYVVESTKDKTVLNEARFIEMQTQQQNIDRTGFSGRFLYPAKEGTAIANDQKASFHQNTLVAQELGGATGIYDTALRRTIERENFQNTLIAMFTNASGLDLEAFCMWADKSKFANTSILGLTDGWIKRAGIKLYGKKSSGSSTDNSDFDGTKVETMLKAMLKAYPKEYLKNLSQARFYVPWDILDAYRDYVIERSTGAGDIALTTDWTPVYKGIVLKYAPVLEDTEGKTTVGTAAMLVIPQNLCYGIFHEITVEPDRIPRERKTDWIITLEADANYENENAVVVAFPETEKPSS